MKAEVDPKQIHTRKADKQGRISLPSHKYSEKEITVAIIEVEKPKEDKNTEEIV
jgi:hypothetical protein